MTLALERNYALSGRLNADVPQQLEIDRRVPARCDEHAHRAATQQRARPNIRQCAAPHWPTVDKAAITEPLDDRPDRQRCAMQPIGLAAQIAGDLGPDARCSSQVDNRRIGDTGHHDARTKNRELRTEL